MSKSRGRRSPFSPWQAVFKPAKSPALGEVGMVGILAYVLAENPAAAATLFSRFVDRAHVRDNGRTKRLLSTMGEVGETVQETLAAAAAGRMPPEVQMAVATEVEMTPRGLENPEDTGQLGRGDLSIAVLIPHRIGHRSHVQAQVIVEAKREGEPLDRVGRGQRWLPRHDVLKQYRRMLQPSAYAGIWTTYSSSDNEADLRVMATIGTCTPPEDWYREYVERFDDLQLDQQTGLGPNLSWQDVIDTVRPYVVVPPTIHALDLLERAAT